MVDKETATLFKKVTAQLDASGKSYVLIVGDESKKEQLQVAVKASAFMAGIMLGTAAVQLQAEFSTPNEEAGTEFATSWCEGLACGMRAEELK